MGETIARMFDSAQIEAREERRLRQQCAHDLTGFSAVVARPTAWRYSLGAGFNPAFQYSDRV